VYYCRKGLHADPFGGQEPPCAERESKGNYDEAKELYKRSLEIKRRIGDMRGTAMTLGQMGRLAEEQSDLELAERLYQEAYQIFQKLGAGKYLETAKKDLELLRSRKASS
jgi:tetratricopeptide (TPR) repeat protein